MSKLDGKACRKFVAECIRLHKGGAKRFARNLYLIAKPKGTASWIFRYQRANRSRDMGLGSYRKVPLPQARELALALNRQLDAGLDPFDERQRERERLNYTGSGTRPLSYCMFQLVCELEPTWRSKDSHRYGRDWLRSVERNAPQLWDKPVSEIDPNDVAIELGPFHKAHPKRANDVMGRIDQALRWAVQHGYRAPNRGLLTTAC